MINNLDDLSKLLDLLHEKRVKCFDYNGARIELELAERREVHTYAPEPTVRAVEEEVNPATGLTKSAEEELFYSAS